MVKWHPEKWNHLKPKLEGPGAYGFFFKPNLPSIGDEIVGIPNCPRTGEWLPVCLTGWRFCQFPLWNIPSKNNASNGCKHINMDVNIWGYHLSRCWMIFRISNPTGKLFEKTHCAVFVVAETFRSSAVCGGEQHERNLVRVPPKNVAALIHGSEATSG